MCLKLERYLKPDHYCDSLEALDLDQLHAAGYRLLLIDVDNTLGHHGAHEADAYAQHLVARAQASGLACHIISNGSRKRIRSFARSLRLPYTAMANKPSVRAIVDACRQADVDPAQAVMVGDQILTDVICARRAGALAILVRPRSKQEAPNVRIKRLPERWLLKRFRLDPAPEEDRS